MDKSWMNIADRISDPRYELGVNEFLDFAYHNKQVSSKVPCPCKNCNNYRKQSRTTILDHLLRRGITVGYENWVHHGEPYLDDSDDDMAISEGSDGYNDMDDDDDDLDEMLNNIGESRGGVNWHSDGESSSTFNKDVETLRLLLAESHLELYTGCKTYSKFSFIVTMLHLKTKSGWTIKSFDSTLDVFRKALPTPSLVPKNFYEAKKYVRDLGFYGEKIHACVNDCVLYRDKYKLHTDCPNVKCKEPRFKDKNSKVPQKVLRYFPLKPRLERLFIDKQLACDMRWHKEKRVNDDNIVRHPADSEAWKHLDRVDSSFASHPRNIRLGLAKDGFNLFGNLSNPYSIWPVFVVPYNLPPWKCMKDPYMFMSMLIPGPNSPKINIDVYLQPLIDELKDLWVGIEAYDSHIKEHFTLRTALLWTINDFHAYSMLSGWIGKGYDACPICMDETSSRYLPHSRKICYMGHRRFLSASNQWRRDKKNFDGKVDYREPVAPKSGNEILKEIDYALNMRKRKSLKDNRGWKKKSVFFQLEYWAKLKLRHNIDIMHVVNNVTESLIGTLFNIKGKTKDTWKSRRDLMDERLKKSLHLKSQSNGSSFIMPMACYHLTKDEKFLELAKIPGWICLQYI